MDVVTGHKVVNPSTAVHYPPYLPTEKSKNFSRFLAVFGAGETIAQLLATFSPLSNRNVKLYIGGLAISHIGTWMQNTALAWLVWNLKHSASALGVVGTMGMLPFLFLAPWAGVWADRLDRRKLLIGTQFTSMALALVLAILVQTETVQIFHVYLLALLLGCVNALDMPAHQAFLCDLSGVVHVRKTILLNNIVFQACRLSGPFIAGCIIHWVDLQAAFWLNCLSFAPLILSLQKVNAQPLRNLRRTKSLSEFMESLRFVQADRKIQYLFLFTVFVTFFAFSNFQILAAYASQVMNGGPDILGLLMSAPGLGALVGSLVIIPFVNRFSRIGVVLASACTWTGVCFLALAVSQSLPISLLALILGATTIPVVMATVAGLIQTMSTDMMRARLASVWLMVVFGVQPLAYLGVGYYAQLVNVRAAIALNGLLMVISSLVLIGGLKELRAWRLKEYAIIDSQTFQPGS